MLSYTDPTEANFLSSNLPVGNLSAILEGRVAAQVKCKLIQDTSEFKIFRHYYCNNKILNVQVGRENLNMSLFEDGMVLYIENPKVSTQNLFTLMNEFSIVVTYNINIQKSVTFPYINNEISESTKTTQFKITPKNKIPNKKPRRLKIYILKTIKH